MINLTHLHIKQHLSTPFTFQFRRCSKRTNTRLDPDRNNLIPLSFPKSPLSVTHFFRRLLEASQDINLILDEHWETVPYGCALKGPATLPSIIALKFNIPGPYRVFTLHISSCDKCLFHEIESIQSEANINMYNFYHVKSKTFHVLTSPVFSCLLKPPYSPARGVG